jgi:hypothetical protein
MVEDLIRDGVEEAAGYFTDRGDIRENRLRERRNVPIRATALANALLDVGECGR